MEFSINITVDDDYKRVDVALHESLSELFRASEDALLDEVKTMAVDDQFDVESVGGHFGVQNVTIHRIA